MHPLFAAVAQSTRLRELDCSYYQMSAEFARDVMLPAIRRNASLRCLRDVESQRPEYITDELSENCEAAEALVAERR